MANSTPTPGEHIRSVRKRLGLTLSQVGERTGLAVSTLSKLEKGNVSLSYDKLMLLSRGLGVDMAELLHDAQGARSAPSGGGRRVVHRAGDGQVVDTQSYKQTYLASELLNKRFTPLIAEVRARTLEEFKAEFGDLIRHPGEEFAFVIEGEVVFHSELYAPVTLKPGDSIFFDSEMGHAYLRASDETCRLVATCAPRNGQDEMAQHFLEASQRLAAPPASASPKAARAAARPKPKATRR
ncbi:XRE family transcriptional regulator [Roseateles asaccharophilus]|uniref:Transcriptional regulator with XRE-family HTH domain n=1 Tax=Roseateles asaccharophilus TaxID=582607 RepID=A0ABU2A8S8_9BURK|nr:XRE family transcriptional regulator [Roseateles asaccharophilus]MDR7333606.1 transcriptional regulator with XRE-family HTH domain [Roseateles asaccharophilus]